MMDNMEKSGVIIEKQIPVERQINFLRNWIFDRDLTVYKVLKEKLGAQGEELNNLIQIRIRDRAIALLGNDEHYVEKVKDIPAYADRVLGYRVDVDHDNPEESQITLRSCPYFEKAKEYGLEREICRLICDFEVDQAKERGYGEVTILSKLSEGADRCTFTFKKKKVNKDKHQSNE